MRLFDASCGIDLHQTGYSRGVKRISWLYIPSPEKKDTIYTYDLEVSDLQDYLPQRALLSIQFALHYSKINQIPFWFVN